MCCGSRSTKRVERTALSTKVNVRPSIVARCREYLPTVPLDVAAGVCCAGIPGFACTSPSAVSSSLRPARFVFVFEFIFVFIFVFAKNTGARCPFTSSPLLSATLPVEKTGVNNTCENSPTSTPPRSQPAQEMKKGFCFLKIVLTNKKKEKRKYKLVFCVWIFIFCFCFDVLCGCCGTSALF